MPTLDQPVIDVRGRAHHCEDALAAFQSLAQGESLVVVSHHAPRKLLGLLQEEHRGEFEWSPLEAGPERWRTEITRRAAPCGSQREILEALAWDHDRLEAIERGAFDRLDAGDLAGARAAWTDFVFGLCRHIRFEDEILFPVFEDATGHAADFGPTGVMRAEHREIERLLEAISLALATGGDPRPLREELHRVLGGHNVKEEQVLYPLTDRVLDAEARDALVARIQAS